MGGFLPPLKFLLLIVTINWAGWTGGVKGYAEICSDGILIQVSHRDCPGGILFQDPEPVSCAYPDRDDRSHLSEFCGDFSFDGSSKRLQYLDPGVNDNDGPSGTSYDSPCQDSCGGRVSLTPQNTMGSGSEDGDEPSEDARPSEENQLIESQVLNQTLRMFLHMTDHLVQRSPEGPDLRLMELLSLSFKVLGKHCSPEFVIPEFTQDIQKAFLFLLRESDMGQIQDVTLHEHQEIKKVLTKCSIMPIKKPFAFRGTLCRPESKITHILRLRRRSRANGENNNNNSIPYMPNDLSFRWGKYDFPVDATWGVMDFTHGVCYGAFNLDSNSHHLYQRAMESIFTPEITARWRTPPKIKQKYYWDHMFRSRVRTTMQNLDACIQAAYLDSPFLHRLKRPWVTKDFQESGSRKKRSIGSNAWCLQSTTAKDTRRTKMCSS